MKSEFYPLVALEHNYTEIDSNRIAVFCANLSEHFVLSVPEFEILEILKEPIESKLMLENCLRQHAWDSDAILELDGILENLYSYGLVVSLTNYWNLLFKGRGTETLQVDTGYKKPNISALAWPTLNRPESLEKSIRAWIEVFSLLAPAWPEIYVLDSGTETKAQTLAVCKRIAQQYKGSVYYLDLNSKADLVKNLPLDLHDSANFALGLSDLPPEPCYGANINLFSLILANKLYAICDDDVFPDFVIAKDAREGLCFDSSLDPSRINALVSWSEVESVGQAINRPLLYAHKTYLGAKIKDLVSATQQIDYTKARPRDVERFANPHAQVSALSFHYRGDSGMNQAFYLLHQRSKMPQDCFSDQRYQAIRESKLLFRSLAQDTLGGTEMINGHVCIDGRRLLPPSTPLGRNHDGLWAYMLKVCNPYDILLNPIETVLHKPWEKRQMPAPEAWSLKPSIPTYLVWIIQDLLEGNKSLVGDYRALGEAIENQASLSTNAFNAWLSRLAAASYIKTAGYLSELKRTHLSRPKQWASDCSYHINKFDEALYENNLATPWEFSSSDSSFQDYLGKFGLLLIQWQRLVDETVKVRATILDKCRIT